MTRTTDSIEAGLTAIRAEKHNTERECEDAMTAAAAPFRARIAELDRAEAAMEPLVAKGTTPPAAADPPKGGRRQGSRRKDSTSKASPPADARRDGAAGREQGMKNRRAVIDAVRAKPGASTTELVEATGLERSTVSQHLAKLVRASSSARPALRMEKDPDDGRVRRYYPQEADVAPVRDGGAKTNDEQKIIDVLRAADGPLPPNEIAVRTRIRSDHVPQMAQQLNNRGVIERIPPKRDGLPPRYQPARQNGERKLPDAIADAIA